MAKGTGLSHAALHWIEMGQGVNLETASALARLFGVRINDIWPGVDSDPRPEPTEATSA